MRISEVKRGICLLLVFLFALSSSGQTEACAIFDVNGVPGLDNSDILFVAELWLEEGLQAADFDSNGIVDIRDLTLMGKCVHPHSHGLLARYYGFENGDPDQDILFPDFAAIPGNPNPVVIKVATTLNEFEGYEGFLNSDMRYQFGATFAGYLYVPESAEYTFSATATRSLRVLLDEAPLLFFDGSPGHDEATMVLPRGFHTIHMEFYTDYSPGSISLAWSGGSVIGAGNRTIGPDYLYHLSAEVPDFTGTDLELLFDPPSGSLAGANPFSLDVFALGPNSNLALSMDGVALEITDGKYQLSTELPEGLNEFLFQATDGDGRSREIPYRVFNTPTDLNISGLAANLFATQFQSWPIPRLVGRETFATTTTQSTHLEEVGGETVVGGIRLTRNAIAELVGTIDLTQAGLYQFRIHTGAGALFINGELIAGTYYDYTNQYQPRGKVRLESGTHHWRVVAGHPEMQPIIMISYSIDGGPEDLLPDGIFAHNEGFAKPPRVLAPAGSGGRVQTHQAAEYLFGPADVFADTTNHGFDLPVDPRPIARTGGGISYRTPGTLTSQDLGLHMAGRARETGAASLEVDFVYDEELDDTDHKRLISLGDPWNRYYMIIYTVHNDLFFYLSDGTEHILRVDNIIERGNRYHVVATYNNTEMKLYVNGSLADEFTPIEPIDITTWPNLLQVNVGHAYRRTEDPPVFKHQLLGTFLVAAAYAGHELSAGEVQTNYQANQVLRQIPTEPLAVPDPVTYPRAGTSATQLAEAFHYLNRLSFGPSPESVNEFLDLGATAWLQQQMNPAAIDDSMLEGYLATGFYDPEHFYRDLLGQTLYRQVTSKRQLLEVMTWFWENHFNTQLFTVVDLKQELAENERFREHALGNFTDLLLASGMGYPMTLYLDNNSNVVGAPNENYGREIMELHTLGVNRGYTQEDIVELSRCFTGWSVRDGDFYFNPGIHDYAEKNLLGLTIPAGGGIIDALTVIGHLVAHQSTAEFISWKLCQVLIADEVVLDPPSPVVFAGATAFQTSGGDIAQTLNAIIGHAAFNDPANIDNKIKTPLEFLTTLIRMTESYPVTPSAAYHLELMSMILFEYPDPTGFSEEAVSWVSPIALQERWNLVQDYTGNLAHGMLTGFDPRRFFAKYGAIGSEQLLDFFENLTTHGTQPAGVRAIAENWLTDGDPGNFIVTPEIIDTRIRQTLALYLRLSEFNKQ